MSQSATQVHREALQRQTQQDWANREYIELVSGSIKRIDDLLNAFEKSCRSRLTTLNEKLTSLERKVDYLEARVGVARDAAIGEQQQQQQQLDQAPQQLH